jgi:hypothetical protein
MPNTGFTLPPKLYDFLKWVALIVLPAAAVLIITIGNLLHWDAATTTGAIVTAVDTFLGLVLGKSSSNFKQQEPETFGNLVFGTDEDGSTFAKRIQVTKDNPVFPVGQKVSFNVIREVDQK